TMLRKNEASLDEALRIYPAFTRVFTNALGTGPWFDTYLGGVTSLSGLVPSLTEQLREALNQ
ncbi:MAG: hypothetical protein ABW075_09590, partial [Aeromicrobium sp.]